MVLKLPDMPHPNLVMLTHYNQHHLVKKESAQNREGNSKRGVAFVVWFLLEQLINAFARHYKNMPWSHS